MGCLGEYKTSYRVKNKCLGRTHKIVLLIVFVVNIAIIVSTKSYQEVLPFGSVVTTKIKGVGMVNKTQYPKIQEIWDVADYVVPPKENNALFVLTNMKVTDNQSIAICAEDPQIPGANCTNSTDCPAGRVLPTGNGIMTGVCKEGVCLIYAWCPVERSSSEVPHVPLLLAAENFTVFIRNHIEFSHKSTSILRRKNTFAFNNRREFSKCRYQRNDPIMQYCPIFRLKDIATYAGENFREMAVLGSIMQIKINWKCDLDCDKEKCKPEYKFHRLDSSDSTISNGYNFRYARYYKDSFQREFRKLFKGYGIQFVVTVTGDGRKATCKGVFSAVAHFISYFAVVGLICEFCLCVLFDTSAFTTNLDIVNKSTCCGKCCFRCEQKEETTNERQT